LFAKLISLFDFWGQYLQDQTNFWCLMFTVLAAGVGVSYFVLGWSSNTVSFVSVKLPRKVYHTDGTRKSLPLTARNIFKMSSPSLSPTTTRRRIR
jgi:prepilin signal peptidase PulO-like enzyme (type II secretory pathway)